MEAIVRFSYKRTIDKDAVSAWDKAVFEASWFEYRLQVQNFPEFRNYPIFSDFLKNVSGADQIHSRISPSVYPLLSQLGGKFPVLTDAHGERLKLNQFALTILDTDFENKEKHVVTLEFVSSPMFLTSEFVQNFIVSDVENIDAFKNGEEIKTLTIPNQQGLNIYSIQKTATVKAHIYTSANRSVTENDWHRRVSIVAESNAKHPLSMIQSVNDETLAPGRSKFYSGRANTTILLLPMIGALSFVDADENEQFLSTGEIVMISGHYNFSVLNPYNDEQVNYLVIEMLSGFAAKPVFSKTAITSDRNVLQPAFESSSAKGFLGIFDGRQQSEFVIPENSGGIFVFVINGAFEFANRLLETRDALTVWDAYDVDFEALSGNAILLLIECNRF